MDNNAIDSFTATAGLVGEWDSPDTLAQVEFAIAALSLEPGERVLDLPCGNGRHARALAERGVQVTAVDVDAASLALARRDCAHPKVGYRELDARAAAELDVEFDAVVSLFSCIGYFEDEQADEAALRAMCSVLRPGGRLLLSTANGPVVAGAGESRALFEPPGLRIERVDRYDPARRCLERRFSVLDTRSGERTQIRHRRRLYAPDELIAHLRACGIANLRCAGDYGGAPFEPERSPHVIYVGDRQR